MPEKGSKRSLVLAILWSVIAVALAAGIIWALPTIAPLPLLFFGVSVVNAFIGWSVFFRTHRPKDQDQR